MTANTTIFDDSKILENKQVGKDDFYNFYII